MKYLVALFFAILVTVTGCVRHDPYIPAPTATVDGPIVPTYQVPATPIPATSTQVPAPPTATSVPPTATAVPSTAVSSTSTPVPPTPAQAVPPSAANASCPNDSITHEDNGLTNVHMIQTGVGVSWDPCKWNWQSNDLAVTSFSLAQGYEATAQFVGEDHSKVFVGPVALQNVKGFTLRYLDAYRNNSNTDWVTDFCNTTGHQGQGGLLMREEAFGHQPERGDRQFDSVSGNIDCQPDGTFVLRTGTFGPDSSVNPTPAPVLQPKAIKKPTTVVKSVAPAATPKAAKADGPTQKVDATWLQANIGGSWTAPDWSCGAWSFKDKGHQIPLKFAGAGKLNVWIASPVTITASNAGLLSGQTFDEASYTPAGC